MNDLQLEGKWHRVKGAVKQKYGSLFEDDKLFSEGKLEEVLGKIQEKTGKTKEDLQNEIQNWKED